VRIVDQMPLTAVGKIFKPALKRKEACDALGAALRRARIPFQALDVEDTPRGMAAQLQLADAASHEGARQVLGRFPLSFTIS
jgi:fatty-acyl-CoA synthase